MISFKQGTLNRKLLVFPFVVGTLECLSLFYAPYFSGAHLLTGIVLMPVRWVLVSIIPLVIYRFRRAPLSKMFSVLVSVLLLPINFLILFVATFFPLLISHIISHMDVFASLAMINALIGSILLSFNVLRHDKRELPLRSSDGQQSSKVF